MSRGALHLPARKAPLHATRGGAPMISMRPPLARSMPLVALAGLALIGFSAGAGAAWLSEGTATATAAGPLAPSMQQAGLASSAPSTTSTRPPSSTAATSTAPVSSERLPSTERETSPARPPAAAPAPVAPARPPVVRVPVVPAQPAAPAPYRPAPAPAPAPAPVPPRAPAPAVPETITIDLGGRGEIIPQPPVAPRQHNAP